MNTQSDTKLILNGAIPTPIINTIMAELSEDELSSEQLCIVNFNAGLPFELVAFLVQLFSTLKDVTLSASKICSSDAQVIAALIVASKLSKLEILNCNIEDDALATIIEAVNKSSLQILNLRYLHIKKREAKIITDLIEKSSLVELSLFCCTFQNDGFILIKGAINRSGLKVTIDGVQCNNADANGIENARLRFSKWRLKQEKRMAAINIA